MKRTLFLMVMLAAVCQLTCAQGVVDRMITKYQNCRTHRVITVEMTGQELMVAAKNAKERALIAKIDMMITVEVRDAEIRRGMPTDFQAIKREGYRLVASANGDNELVLAKYAADGTTITEFVLCGVDDSKGFLARFTGRFDSTDADTLMHLGE